MSTALNAILEHALRFNYERYRIEELIKQGADVHQHNDHLLACAVLDNNIEMADYLIVHHGMRVTEKQHIFISTKYGYVEMLEYLKRAITLQRRNDKLKEHIKCQMK